MIEKISKEFELSKVRLVNQYLLKKNLKVHLSLHIEMLIISFKIIQKRGLVPKQRNIKILRKLLNLAEKQIKVPKPSLKFKMLDCISLRLIIRIINIFFKLLFGLRSHFPIHHDAVLYGILHVDQLVPV